MFAAVAGGVLLYAASPPRAWWWLAPVAFTLLTLAVHGRRARHGFGLGTVFGLAYLLPLLGWLYEFLGAEFGVWPWLGVVALESVFFGLAGAGMARVARLPGAPVWMAAVVVAAEAARSRVPFGGFPWGRVAFTQADGLFLPLAALGGAVLVGFAVVLTGCALAQVLIRGGEAPRRWIGPAVTAVVPLLVGWAMTPTVGVEPEAGTVEVAAVQGNAPDVGVGLIDENETVRANHIAEAGRLAHDVAAGRAPRPDLVILPESSNTFSAARDDPDLERIAAQLDVPLLVGGIAYDVDGRVSNRVVEWEPGVGATEEYAKQQLVAFSEFIPLRGIAAAVTPFVRQFGTDMVAGDGPGVFDAGGARVGVAICYEVAYDHVLGEATRAGAQLLAVPTNNAWFGRGEMTYQQLAMSRLRAVEHGRAVVVVSTSGVSAIVQPDGTVTGSTGLYTAETLVERVPLRSTLTPATRIGGVPEWVLTALAVLAVAMSIWRRPARVIPEPVSDSGPAVDART
jgi:apolipoprotein N-acyltransferase